MERLETREAIGERDIERLMLREFVDSGERGGERLPLALPAALREAITVCDADEDPRTERDKEVEAVGEREIDGFGLGETDEHGKNECSFEFAAIV